MFYITALLTITICGAEIITLILHVRNAERLIKLPKVIQPVMTEIGIRIQVWSQSLAFSMLLCAWE